MFIVNGKLISLL